MKFYTHSNLIFEFVLYIFLMNNGDCVEDSLRNTNFGKVRGTVEYVHGQTLVEKFYGIPYASPPVGHLRLEVSTFLNVISFFNQDFLGVF